MKKILKKSFILILSLAVILSSFSIAAAKRKDIDDRDYIRVGLYWGSDSKSEVMLESDYGFAIYDEDLNLVDRIDDTKLTLNSNSNYIQNKEFVYFMSAAEDVDDRKIVLTTDPGTSKAYTKAYRDGIAIYENSGLRIINYVTVEHYVWGVVNKEMSSSNPLEALKAQAVAARTYAYRVKLSGDSKHSSYGFDVCTKTDCQVYGAYASESEQTTQACIETENEILTYKGDPIYAYFSAATGGGYTQSLYDAWGLDDVPYLQSKRDEYTPEYTWKFYNTFDEIRQKIKTYYGTDLGTIQKFEVTKTNDHGAVTQITVTGSKCTKVVPRSQLMALFNLKSTFFVLGAKDYKEFEKFSSSSNAGYDLSGSVYVLSKNGVTSVDAEDLYVYNGLATTKIETSKNREIISYESDVCTSGKVYWNGLGYGHGIGLSQNGAKAMANAGFDYTDILNYYYIDVDITDYLDL